MKRNAALLALMLLLGCEGQQRDKPMQRLGERTDRAAEHARSTAEQAANRTDNALERAGDRIENATDMAVDRVENAAQTAENATAMAVDRVENAAESAGDAMRERTSEIRDDATAMGGTVATSTATSCACDCTKLEQERARLEARLGRRAAAYPLTGARVSTSSSAPSTTEENQSVQPAECAPTDRSSCPPPSVAIVEVRQQPRIARAVAPLSRAERREQRRAERYAARHGVSRRADETRQQAIEEMGGTR